MIEASFLQSKQQNIYDSFIVWIYCNRRVWYHWGGYCSSSYCDALRSFQCCHGEFGFVYNLIPITTNNGERQRTTKNDNNTNNKNYNTNTDTEHEQEEQEQEQQQHPQQQQQQQPQQGPILPSWSHPWWDLKDVNQIFHFEFLHLTSAEFFDGIPALGCLLFPKPWPKCGIPSQVT